MSTFRLAWRGISALGLLALEVEAPVEAGETELSGEVSYNGFGALEPEDYLAVALADRASRGEVNSLGRFDAGVSLGWQAHPLISVRGALLANLEDGSALVQPLAEWSVSENPAALIGASLGLGPGEPGGEPMRSEYGGAPLRFYGALRFYL